MQENLMTGIKEGIKSALKQLSIDVPMKDGAEVLVIERPAEMVHGDFSTSVALVLAKPMKVNPVELAMNIVEILNKDLKDDSGGKSLEGIEKIEVAGPGFINFDQTSKSVKENIDKTVSEKDYGKVSIYHGQKMAFEYTDPNPFKQFHIGHLMSNAIGESLSRLAENAGAEVKRFCYQGDAGRHIALTMLGMKMLSESFPTDNVSLSDKVTYLGKAYATGATLYKNLEENKDSEEFKKTDAEVRELNKKIYDRSDAELNKMYDKGRQWSLDHFEVLYKILGTKFDKYFFESETAIPGLEIVKANTAPNGKSVFKESEGAIIFDGENYTDRKGAKLQTRVFVNKDGLPTYEGKEIGLAKEKYEAYKYDKGIYVSGNEQNDYFRVILKTIDMLFPEIENKNWHISHGMLRLSTGKMSSRTGDVITGESLLNDMCALALERMKEREISVEEKQKTAEMIAVAAIKYTILRQAINKDTIFDQEKSLSFEGDSGPYLQYSCVRANSILKKAQEAGIEASGDIEWSPELEAGTLAWSGGKLERLLLRLPEIAQRSATENASHHIANYLMETAGEFNSFYSSTQIVNKDDNFAPYKVLIVKSFVKVMTKGLWLLGIEVPAKM